MMLHLSVPKKKQTHLYLEWPEGTFSANFHFWINFIVVIVSLCSFVHFLTFNVHALC